MYGHPYTPYEVQTRFMADLFEALSAKKVALFESPTGTGKTLSLLCPAVAWLRSAAKRSLDNDLAQIDASSGPQWLKENAKTMRTAEFEAQLEAHRTLVAKAKLAAQTAVSSEPKRRHIDSNSSPTSLNEFVLEDLSETDRVLASYDSLSTAEADDELSSLRTPTKVFFASRTHSQLSQVADALAKLQIDDPVRFAALASRKQLCIHPEVKSLNSVSQMNEKCADLQKHSKCTFRSRSAIVRNQALGQIMDIEDLARFGRVNQACPYYAARETAQYAEIVALPYPLLLSERNRAVLGIDITNSVVVIDEAHNLIDTVTALHSASLSQATTSRALKGLQQYDLRVGPRLSPSNLRKVHQIIRLLESLSSYFASLGVVKPGTPIDKTKLFAGNLDTLDIQELSTFVHTSKLVFKVDSYLRSITTDEQVQQPSSLGVVMDFVLVATDPISEGKLFHDLEENTVILRYLVLDASQAFKNIVDEAKIVVLAGGTMEPVSEFTNFLVPFVAKDLVATKSYNHIVPKSQLMVAPLSDFRFTFATRSDPKVIFGLGELLLRVVSNVPCGVVAFFPGYKYLTQVVKAWQSSGLLKRLEQQKKLFTEMSSSSNVFENYSIHALDRKGKGALLLAVVGGKLSEGINFSDDLARAVVMVGLPFPNAFSAEMVAKRTYIEEQAIKVRHKSQGEAVEEARQYYENLAMRAVNQSVGRAVRHINDYAAIFLIDERYRLPSIQAKLSKWIRGSIMSEVENLEDRIRQFFSRNNVHTI